LRQIGAIIDDPGNEEVVRRLAAAGRVALMVIAVALFGSKAISERAFRLLRWFGNRPEPPTPN